MLFVFLSKKLISTDTICPVLVELKNKAPAKKIVLFTLDKGTIEQIKKNNVLNHFIDKNAKIIQIGGSRKPNPFNYLQRISWMFVLITVHLITLLGFAKIIHFGALEKWPYRILSIFNSRKIFYFESNCWGYSETVVKVDQAYSSTNRHAVPITHSSHTLVAFSKSWPLINSHINKKKQKFLLSPSRSWHSWHHFLERDCEQLWEAELKKLNARLDNSFIFFALGTIDELPSLNFNKKKIFEVVEDTLNYLLAFTPTDCIVILKPHPITDMTILNKIIANVQSDRVKVSYLHPGLIAKKSKFAICNYYSTVMADCINVGIPTVEFTNYADFALKITKNKSVRPEHVTHFISTDNLEELRLFIEQNFNNKQSSISNKTFDYNSQIDRDLLLKLI